eukprot:495422-Amphidinium_carterae.1
MSRASACVDVPHKFHGSEWSALSDSDKIRLQDMCLSDGGAHTIKNYLREFERFEKWCASLAFPVWPWQQK